MTDSSSTPLAAVLGTWFADAMQALPAEVRASQPVGCLTRPAPMKNGWLGDDDDR